MRKRAWRRHKEEVHLIKRLRRYNHYYYKFTDVNNINYYEHNMAQLIGTQTYFMSKTMSTDKYDSRYKCKYSPNRKKYIVFLLLQKKMISFIYF
jgi:hypothetical protein